MKSWLNFEHYLDLQYYGQAHSLPIPLSDLSEPAEEFIDVRLAEEGILSAPLQFARESGFEVTNAILDAAVEVFHREHLREFGHSDPGAEIQVVHARVFGKVVLEKKTQADVAARRHNQKGGESAIIGERHVYFGDQLLLTSIHNRDALDVNALISGPAIVEQIDSTIVVPPGMTAEVDKELNLIINVRG